MSIVEPSHAALDADVVTESRLSLPVLSTTVSQASANDIGLVIKGTDAVRNVIAAG